MIVYLDANVIIYLVEKIPAWGPKGASRIRRLRAAGDGVAVSDISRLECLVGPFTTGNAAVAADFGAFFGDPAIQVFPVTASVCERAARIRATHRFKALDALHLASAVENGCGLFLTNDLTLGRFTDVPVEILT
jgi:predicted nucleic acid-binding protein